MTSEDLAAYHGYIKLAIERGYWFDFNTQEFVTPFGNRIKPQLYGKQRYPSSSISLRKGDKTRGSFPFHKFIGYVLYGEDSFQPGINVRHLDDNPLNLSKENIVLGSSQDNQLDKNPKVRSNAAVKARQAQGLRPFNQMISDDIAKKILLEYLEGKGNKPRAPKGLVKDIAEKYNYNRVTVQSICSGTNFKDIYKEVVGEGNV